ncbi:RagB/SusD family nutrient uptake outer membrane protein [Alistipes sp.]|uniref:RagB/SusD family nutrient uptake outer membrane protein n=1 Tax=Alistipes sp. TaxID=1872444 RepID=UPI003AF03C5B
MKKNLVFAVIAALSLTACVGDLDQTPMADNVVNNVYGDPEYRMSALAKVYGAFSLVGQGGSGNADIDVNDAGASEFLRAWWSIQTVSTDECKCVWGDAWVAEIGGNAWTATKNDAVYATYTRGMMMIAFANDFLRNTSDDDPEVAVERAEVRFLRAYAYWVLLDCFGNPPFVTENDPVGAFKPAQTDAPTLFNWLRTELTELTSAASNLKAPHTQIYPRVDKGAAYGLLARLCLNHKTYLGTEDTSIYKTARDAAEEVCKAYTLCSDFSALFRGDNGENPDALKEIIYASCYDANKTQSYGGTSFFILAGKGEQYTLGIDGNWNGLVAGTESVVRFVGQGVVDKANVRDDKTPGDDKSVFMAVDKRALFSLSDCDSKTVDASNFSNGWHVVKYDNRIHGDESDAQPTAKYSSIDFPMIRLAEMYLIYAEAQARIDGGQTADAKAVGYIKDLQIRAGLTPTFSTVTLEDVFNEISREMFWEGQRRTTLIRFNRFSSADFLWPFKGGVKNGQGFARYMELFPLPSDDLLANDNLKQNPGYTN